MDSSAGASVPDSFCRPALRLALALRGGAAIEVAAGAASAYLQDSACSAASWSWPVSEHGPRVCDTVKNEHRFKN